MSWIIFIFIGFGFVFLSTQVIYQLGVCILYAVCSLFCFFIAYALIFQAKQREESKKIREFFGGQDPKQIFNNMHDFKNQIDHFSYVNSDSVSKNHSQENQSL